MWRKRWREGYYKLPGAAQTIVLVEKGRVLLDSPQAEAEVTEDGDIEISVKSRDTIANFMSFDPGLTSEVKAWIEAHETNPEDWITNSKGWRVSDYGRGYSGTFDSFLGDPFSFTHFKITKGPEGAAIEWESGELEIWLGDFNGWISDQEEPEWNDPDTIVGWNRYFEGGLLLALEALGLTSDPEPLPDNVFHALPKMLRDRYLEAEKVMGQKHLWPED